MAQSSQPDSQKMPTWRDAFDAVMQPLTSRSEAWVQTDGFMDALTVMWRIQRQATQQAEACTGAVLRLAGMPSRRDVLQLSNQVASLERQLRELVQVAEEQR